jgi:hypothetical protein
MKKLFTLFLTTFLPLVASADGTIITFASETVKSLCVANWDTDGDGELSYDEAAAVTDLGGVFSYKYNWGVTTFDEFQYFTGLKSIATAAFAGCRALTQITLPPTVTSIGSSAFMQCGFTSFTVPNHVKSIGGGAFANCYELTSFTLSKSVTSVGSSVFDDCRSLTSIKVEDGNPMYDSRNGCNAIIETPTNMLIAGCNATVIPDGITAIRMGSFRGFKNLTTLMIPKSVICIEYGAFEYCGMTTITVEEGNPWYDSRDNCNAVIETATNILVLGCMNTVIPNSVTAIGDGSLSVGNSLTSIAIPNGVKSIGELAFCSCGFSSIQIPGSVEFIDGEAFNGCEDLTSLELPEGVRAIGERIAANCSSLTSATFPSSLSHIGNNVFDYCHSFASLTVNWKTPLAIDAKVFRQNDLSSITLYVPKGTKSLYEAADVWKNFKEIVETDSEGGSVLTQEINGIYYILTSSTKTAEVTSSPDPYSGEIVIPETVEYGGTKYSVVAIGDKAFYECHVTSVSIPNSVTSFGEESFSTNDLKSLTIPNSVKSIGDLAFSFSRLESIIIPKSVINMGSYLFMGCGKLSSIAVESDNPLYDSREDCNAIITKNSNSLLSGCAVTQIPNSVTEIGYSAFAGTGLTSIKLSNSIRRIDHNAFAYCSQLEEVRSLIKEPFVLYTSVFTNYDIPLYVPSGTKAKYESMEGWSNFLNIIEETEKEEIIISKAKQVAYCSDKDLNFSDMENLKAYVATGYDKTTGTIWLSRVYDVPANTGFLLVGDADTYEVPVSTTGSSSYYKNMFKGTLDGTTIYTTDGKYTNYYLSNGADGVGFYKVTKEEGVTLSANRAYLPIPTVIEAVGEAGSSVAISVGGAEQVPYYSDQSLDFTTMEAKGMKAYTATGYDYATGTIWLSRVKQVPAETGVLIMAPKGDYDVPTVSVASVYENMFKGTLTGTTIYTEEDGFINYYLSKGTDGVGFYKVTKEEGVALGKNRCYLQIPKVRPASSSRGGDASQIALDTYGIGTSEMIAIPLFGNTGTTGIKDVRSVGEKSDVYYNLQGQRVDNPTKGLYIMNGNKVIIK